MAATDHGVAECPLCHGRQTQLHARAMDIEYFTSDDAFEIWHCSACGVLFVHPMLADELDRIYPANYYSFQKLSKNLVVSIKEWLDRRALERLTRQIPGDNLSVLDIGGGTGWLADQVKAADPRFRSSTIVDIDPGARDVALQAGHAYFLGRFEEFDAAGRRFDLILMLNLIEHVPDPRAVLAKAASLLTPNGLIWIKTPNFDSLDARLFRHRSWAGYHTPRHFVIFRRESLERIGREAGLEVAGFEYTQGAPFWSVSILAALQRLGWVRVSAERPAIYHPLTPILQALSAGFDFARQPFGAKLSQMVLTLRRARD
ncbi:MAG: class I SAM-dependent methyltransferase [Mesorhizobium sp.]|nr:class I SAM-dependent methyltransferase [Mesorhizobium sp.]